MSSANASASSRRSCRLRLVNLDLPRAVCLTAMMTDHVAVGAESAAVEPVSDAGKDINDDLATLLDSGLSGAQNCGPANALNAIGRHERP